MKKLSETTTLLSVFAEAYKRRYNTNMEETPKQLEFEFTPNEGPLGPHIDVAEEGPLGPHVEVTE